MRDELARAAPGRAKRSSASGGSTSARSAASSQAAGRQTQVLAETTQSLREALSSTTARGQWGERMAEDVLRLAGFVDGVNYRRHQPLPGSGGIPDYTFLLPQGLSLHMDVKFPLNNYLRILDATSDVEREHARKEFLRDARLRLREVTRRDVRRTRRRHRRLRAALHPQRAGVRVHPRTGPLDPRRRAARQGGVLLAAHIVRGARGRPPGGRQLPAEPHVARDPRAYSRGSRSSGTASSTRWTRSAATSRRPPTAFDELEGTRRRGRRARARTHRRAPARPGGAGRRGARRAAACAGGVSVTRVRVRR